MQRFALGLWVLGLALFATPSRSYAQTATVGRGLELSVRGGAGDFLGRFPRDPGAWQFGAGAAVGGSVGYRASSRWSIGARFQYQWLRCEGSERCDAVSIQAASGGVELRFRPLRERALVTPWVSVGVEFGAWSSTAQWSLADGASTSTGRVFAIATPVSVGADFKLARGLTVGPTIGFSTWFPFGACVTQASVTESWSNTECSFAWDITDYFRVNAAWFGGVDVRYTLPL